jgi:hypothetical protein
VSDRAHGTSPDPATEIRITALHATRGINYWSRRPVTRMDLVVGAFDDISSADVPGVTESLVSAMPGLIEHRCSIGQRGGFITRLRRGTYAPHIVEHIALELQAMIGHDVGYGRTRGGDVPGEYTLVVEHLHEQVGLRAAALALETVQRAFAGTLEGVEPIVEELTTLARTPDAPPIIQRVFCGVIGGAHRAVVQRELQRRLGESRVDSAPPRENAVNDSDIVVDVSPAFLMQAGLPYARSRQAIVLDMDVSDVAERYRERERAVRLLSTVADAVEAEGFVICPAKEWEIQDYARDQGCRVAVFATDDDVTTKDLRSASAVAIVRDGRIVLEHCRDPEDGGALDPSLPAAAQVASVLGAFVAREPCRDANEEPRALSVISQNAPRTP